LAEKASECGKIFSFNLGKSEVVMPSKPVLDSESKIQQADPQDMLGAVETFDRQCQLAYQIAGSLKLPKMKDLDNIIVIGMGGSAIGGDLLRCYMRDILNFPIEVFRSYSVPRWVNQRTLAIASSYSGSTEETIAAYKDARKRGARIVVQTQGGTLAKMAQKDGFAWINITPPRYFHGAPIYQPRAALGYSFFPMLGVVEKVFPVPDQSGAVNEAITVVKRCIDSYRRDVPVCDNVAKQVAMACHKHMPVIYTADEEMEVVGRRWRNQFNENAKVLALSNVLPEMNHNEIVGWSALQNYATKWPVFFLQDKGDHRKVKRRFEVTAEILQESCGDIYSINSDGRGLLARLFSLIVLGDFVSVYLSILNKVDPSPIPPINRLKAQLASRK
jgi:glucose/mannose-6-phosphate isomerase